EIWFSVHEKSPHNTTNVVYAIDVITHKSRKLLSTPSTLAIHDVSPDGKVLVEQEVFGGGIIFSGNADPFEKDLSWLDDSSVEDISDDGSKILFDETGDAAGSTHGVYLRNTDGSPAIRLADGYAGQISPDGKWVLSFTPTFPSQLV